MCEMLELGYATTIHAAQGVTADTTHGLVDELMTREQLYTMVSRGRTANHLYLPVGGDGDPHGIVQTAVRRRLQAPGHTPDPAHGWPPAGRGPAAPGW